MNPEIKAEWVAALRSGQYTQATGQLRRNGVGYCCLGVLCQILAPRVNGRWTANHTYVCDGSAEPVWGVLPKPVAQLAGITCEGDLPDEPIELGGVEHGSLMELNDAGMAFPGIADIIEREF